jgi:hypothetical protein
MTSVRTNEDRIRSANAVARILIQVGLCDRHRGRREPAPPLSLRERLSLLHGHAAEEVEASAQVAGEAAPSSPERTSGLPEDSPGLLQMTEHADAGR